MARTISRTGAGLVLVLLGLTIPLGACDASPASQEPAAYVEALEEDLEPAATDTIGMVQLQEQLAGSRRNAIVLAAERVARPVMVWGHDRVVDLGREVPGSSPSAIAERVRRTTELVGLKRRGDPAAPTLVVHGTDGVHARLRGDTTSPTRRDRSGPRPRAPPRLASCCRSSRSGWPTG